MSVACLKPFDLCVHALHVKILKKKYIPGIQNCLKYVHKTCVNYTLIIEELTLHADFFHKGLAIGLIRDNYAVPVGFPYSIKL